MQGRRRRLTPLGRTLRKEAEPHSRPCLVRSAERSVAKKNTHPRPSRLLSLAGAGLGGRGIYARTLAD